MVGHTSMKQMIHLDTNVFKELKRRNCVRELKKKENKSKNRKSMMSSHRDSMVSLSSSMSARTTLRGKDGNTSVVSKADDISSTGEEALEGATAEDADAEEITHILENLVLGEKGFLTAFEYVES